MKTHVYPRFYPREHEKIWEIFRHFLFKLNSIFFCLQESINNRKCFVLFSRVYSPPFVVVRRKRVCLRFVRRLLACGCKQRWTVASKMKKIWICIGRPPTPKNTKRSTNTWVNAYNEWRDSQGYVEDLHQTDPVSLFFFCDPELAFNTTHFRKLTLLIFTRENKFSKLSLVLRTRENLKIYSHSWKLIVNFLKWVVLYILISPI